MATSKLHVGLLAATGAATYLAYRYYFARRALKQTLILFDVDGTLAVPAQKAHPEMVAQLARLRAAGYLVGIVGAGDFAKQEGQLGGEGLRERLDFCFSENGVHSCRGTELLHCKSIVDQVGEARWKEFEEGLQQILSECSAEAEGLLQQAAGASATLASRGTFLERRMCTCNVCIIGRTPTMSKAERASFEAADKAAGLRKRVLDELVRRFGPSAPHKLNFSIGGQIGIDCAPVGWDKTFCLQFLPRGEFPIIHFFGDKTEEGGGDYELYHSERIIGHTVRNAEHTMELIDELFLKPQGR